MFGDVCCLVTLACEESGELGRLMRWNEVVEGYLSRHLHGPLLSFCERVDGAAGRPAPSSVAG